MKKIIIKPSSLSGDINIQISKSDAHRTLIAASLANTKSVIYPWQSVVGDDITITKNMLEDLNLATFTENNNTLECVPNKNYKKEAILNAKESGTTLRLMLPIISALGIDASFLGEGRLLKRPMSIYHDIWKKNNINLTQTDNTITSKGRIKSGVYNIDGNISSQFISGMIFALSLLENDSYIKIENTLQSKPYIDMTINTLKKFGVNITWNDERTIFIKASQQFNGSNIELDGDWSHASFFIAAAAIKGEITIKGLNKNSFQGDKEIVNIVNKMGASARFLDDNSLHVKSADTLKALDIDISQIPDLAPILALLACHANGKTRLYNAHRLKYKESDRINDLKDSLTRIGASIKTTDDEIEIEGVGQLSGGISNPHNDHRIAMTLAIASMISIDDIIIEDYEVVKKSSASFFSQFESLGGIISNG